MLVEANNLDEALNKVYENDELFLECLEEIKEVGFCAVEYGYNKPYKDNHGCEDYDWVYIGSYELYLDEIISDIGCRELIDFLLENIK